MSKLYEQISENVMDGQMGKVKELVQKAIDEGNKPKDIIENALIPAMNEVGVLFKEGELFVPEVLIAAKAMNGGMDVLEPLLQKGDVEKVGKIVMATVEGDLHDIGINLVAMMLKNAGYEVINLGKDTPTKKVIDAIKEYKPDLVGLSALLTTTTASIKKTVETIKAEGLDGQVKIMVGGAPVTDQFAKSIGAHYSSDAQEAVMVANSLMGV